MAKLLLELIQQSLFEYGLPHSINHPDDLVAGSDGETRGPGQPHTVFRSIEFSREALTPSFA